MLNGWMESSSDSDSEDDVPLSQLRAARAGTPVKTEATNNGTPTATAMMKQEPPQQQQPPPTEEDDDDSDDDVPISQLAVKQHQQQQVKQERPRRTPSPTPHIKREVKASTSPTRPKKKLKISYKQQECTEELYKSLKGQLVQQLLCRWWYAIEWPKTDFKTEHPHEKLHGAQELDGFKGAYIRVKGDAMGTIMDTRSSQDKPSFLHLFSLPSQEIKDLLITAYQKQMRVLREHEGDDAPLLKELASALKTVEKTSAEKADKSVRKVLKQFKEFAQQLECS